MSAQIPIRRTRLASRSTVDENASRAARPTKFKLSGPSSVLADKPDVDNRLRGTLGKSDASTLAAKRKREPLGEATNKNKTVDMKGLKGDDLQSKKSAIGSAVTGARAPLAERTTSSTHPRADDDRDAMKKGGRFDDMAVDAPEGRSSRISRRISTRTNPTSTSTSTAAPRGLAPTAASARRAALSAPKPAIKASVSTIARVRPAPGRKPLGNASNRALRVAVDGEGAPAQKKRRTSSIEPVESLDALTSDLEPTLIKADIPADALDLGPDEPALVDTKEIAVRENEWDDLDKEDADDPLMVSEYVNEIFPYLLELEVTTMANPRYMDTQAELAWRMRGILTDWLIQIHGRFRLLPETLFLTINIIDRFLSSRVVSLVKLQLVGITALFIAAKYEEIMAPSVANFLCSADGNYGEKDILEAEKYILRTLDWNMSYPNPIHFLRRASKADGYDLAVRTVAKYFIEISCLEHRMLECTPSQVAAAGIWLARLVLDKEEWCANLAHYSGYAEAEIIPVARLMLNYLLKPTRHENFFKKYAARKFMKASPFVHMWTRDRWPEGTSVDLEEELPELRRAAKARRDAGQAAGQLAEEEGVLLHG